MIVAVASGKGGTGKTTVAVSLAQSLAARGSQPLLLDCDVEAPNAALLLRPTIEEQRRVGRLVPVIDSTRCTLCGRCAEVCRYHALAVVGKKVLFFRDMCHGCGSCVLNCPAGAIGETMDEMGTLERGHAAGIEFGQGRMDIGQAMATPIIRQLKSWALPAPGDTRPVILDAPPGTACPVVETLRGADVALMVTEPTPFGLHDLRLAIDVARGELGLPVAVVVNRDGVGDRGVDAYCAAEEIPILMRIPLERRIAIAYSEGIPLVEALPAWREPFVALWRQLQALAGEEERP